MTIQLTTYTIHIRVTRNDAALVFFGYANITLQHILIKTADAKQKKNEPAVISFMENTTLSKIEDQNDGYHERKLQVFLCFFKVLKFHT